MERASRAYGKGRRMAASRRDSCVEAQRRLNRSTVC
jgi:hypothetical protein